MKPDWLWDRKTSLDEVQKILRDDQHQRFVEYAALLLSRNNQPGTVFSDYIEMDVFIQNWTRIKKRMKQDRWNDQRILYWQAVYDHIVKQYKKQGVPVHKTRGRAGTDALCRRIGDKIKTIRKEKRLSQKDLARKLGISQQVVSCIERGETNITLLTLKKFAAALGMKATIDIT